MSFRLQLPSVAAMGREAWAAGRRFPAAALAALVVTVAANALVGTEFEDEGPLRLVMAGLLGFPLGVGLTVALERRIRPGAAPTPAALLALLFALLVCAGFWLGWARWTEPVRWTRFVQLAVVFHLLAACLPFLGRDEPRAFWQFNRYMLIRWLVGGLYAATLFAGLALALAALDNLFGLDVHERAYARLWVVLTFLFHPFYFLAGVPARLDDLETDESYPLGLRAFAHFVLVPLTALYLVIITAYFLKGVPPRLDDLETDESYPLGLRAFAHFVLVPLTALYLVIITAYFLKVIVTGEWPSGWIGWLVSGAAAVGILTLLLANPPAAGLRPAWVQSFERWFWPALLPATVMLALAVWKRIDQYGFTERRVFLAVLTLWLGGTALAFTIRRSRHLIVIPASLAVVTLITFAGPLSAYRISARSQLNRLESLLLRLEMIQDGRITAATAAVDPDQASSAADVVRYLASTHGPRRLGPWLEARGVTVPRSMPEDIQVRAAPHGWPGYQNDVVHALGLQGYHTRQQEFVWVNRIEAEGMDVRGWDHMLILRHPLVDRWPGGDTLAARFDPMTRRVRVARGGEVLIGLELGGLLDSLAMRRAASGGQTLPDSLLTVDAEEAGRALRVRLKTVGFRDSVGVWRLQQLEGEVLFRAP